jgi:hypothetical protein
VSLSVKNRWFSCRSITQFIRWGLGTCLPAGILDKNGYLCRHQKGIDSISLITDGSCHQAGGALSGLSEFSSLKMLEWEGIQQSAEVDSLRRCIRHNATQLTDLSMDLSAVLTPRIFAKISLGSNRGYPIQALFPRCAKFPLHKTFSRVRHQYVAPSVLWFCAIVQSSFNSLVPCLS